MAKYYGAIGYIKEIETEPGIWVPSVTERNYYGDVLKRYHRTENSGGVNDNVTLSHEISIIVDPYAIENYGYIRYLEYLGIKWSVTNVSVDLPRLVLSTGGVYNGDETGIA